MRSYAIIARRRESLGTRLVLEKTSAVQLVGVGCPPRAPIIILWMVLHIRSNVAPPAYTAYLDDCASPIGPNLERKTVSSMFVRFGNWDI